MIQLHDDTDSRRRGALWSAPACVLLLSVVVSRPAAGEMGVVSPCTLMPFMSTVGVSSGVLPPYPQPVTFSVHLNGIDPQQVESRTSPGAIDITVSGRQVAGPHASGCGSIGINPVPPGTYVVSLYAVRDGGPATRVVQRSFELAEMAAPPSPPLTPSEAFASTQPVGEVAFQHSVSLDGAAQVSIPVFTPPGRQAIEPSLALTYSSRGGNGPLGVGWSLSGLSTITSCRRSPALDEAYGGTHPDRLCLDGSRLVEVSRSRLPPWQPQRAYAVGEMVQYDGNAYRADEPIDGGWRFGDHERDWTNLGPATATAEYRTETDSYRKVIGRWQRTYDEHTGTAIVLKPALAYPDSLEVYTPDGSILKYAARAGSHASLAGQVRTCRWNKGAPTVHGADAHDGCSLGESQRRAWMLDTVEDRFGNRMEIDYDPAEPLLPVEIRYTYHASAPNTKAVRFGYEPRLDVLATSMDGLAYTAAKLLKTIDIVTPLALSEPGSAQGVLRRYELTYAVHPVTAQSTLTQVKVCAGDDPGAACLSPLRFAYSGTGSLAYAEKPLPISPAPGSAFIPGFNGFRTADMNGDGFDDVLYRRQSGWSYRLSDGVALGQERTTGITAFLDDAELGLSLVNLDRNQTVDALVPQGGTNYAIARGDAAGTFQVSGLSGNIFTPGTGATTTTLSRVLALGDFNGDTLPDLAVRHACREVTPRTVTTVNSYTACRWGVALSQSTSSVVDFTNAMDFRWSGTACTEPTAGQGYTNCAEAQPGDPAFVLDVDRNGENEILVPVRRSPTEVFFRQPDHSRELRTLGFPIGSASASRGTGLSSRRMPRLFLDVNGDGLPDAAEADGGRLSIAVNVGGTFDRPVAKAISAAASAALSLPNELRVGDFNDDGLEDIFLISARILLQSNGQLGFVEKPVSIPVGDDSCQGPCLGFPRRKWDQLLDFNGDGLIDVVQMRGGTGRLLQRTGPRPGLLERITGGALLPEVRFTYRPSAGFQTPAGCTYPQYCLRKGMWLVSEVGVKANVSAQTYPAGFNRTLFSYTGGRFDVRGRGWLGFAERVMTDEQTGATITTTMDNVTRQPRGDGNFAIYRYPGAFRPLREVVQIDSRKDASAPGTILRQTTDYQYRDRFDVHEGNGWCATSVLEDTRLTSEQASAQGQTVGPFMAVAARRSTFDVDFFGLVTRETSEAFEGGFTAAGAVPAGAKVTRLEVTRTPIPPDRVNWLVRRYDRVAVTSIEPARAAVPASATEPARPAVPGRSVTRVTDLRWKPGTTTVERITVEPNHPADRSLYSVTEFEHDPTGNVNTIRVTAHSGIAKTTRTTRLAWDSLDQTLIRRHENPLQHAETFLYYAGLGQLFSSEDANGLRTITRRDRFGRLREIEPASSAGSRISYELAPGARLRTTSTRASGEVSRSYQDRWGQLVREERTRLRGKAALVTRTFDRLGRLEAATLPYYDDDPPAEGAEFAYDNLGRLVEMSIGRRGAASVPGQPITTRDVSRDVETWAFDGLVTEHTNARGVRSRTTLDGAGRVVRSATMEPGTGREVVTRLEYGPFDVLDAITGSAGARTAHGHDLLGRRVSTSDPSWGSTSTGYSGYGEIVSFTHGAGSTTTIERDLLGRAEREVSVIRGGATLRSSYVWDTAARGKGRLAEATSTDDVKTVFTYDQLGRLSRQGWDIPGPNLTRSRYAIETVWDGFGRPQVLKYPAAGNRQLALRFRYEPGGTLHKVADDGTGRAFWTLQKQDASGLALSERFGDSTTTERFIDPRKRIKLIDTTRSSPTGTITLQRLAYEYGRGGLIKSRHDLAADRALRTTQDFSYDFLGRLTQWRVHQNCEESAQEYVFDDQGNCTAIRVLSGIGRNATLRYGPSATSPNAGPFAVRELSEDGTTMEFAYDTGGRRESGVGRTITWTEFDLPRRIQSGATDVTLLYDADRNRAVKQVGSSNTAVYVGGLYELRRSSGGTTHVYNLVGPAGVFGQMSWQTAGAGAPAEETWYFHRDTLATADVASSDGIGGPVRRTIHEPYGQRRHGSALAYPAALPSASSVGFTGHEADDEIGLINMRGRIYDPRTMRFLTPDPLLQSPLFSQSLNLYSYVYNNPVNFTDPTGFQCAGGANACIGQGSGGSNTDGGSGGVGPTYSCASWNPLDCAIPNTGGGAGSGSTQEPPTKEDATRRGADAGPGGGSSGSWGSTATSMTYSQQLMAESAQRQAHLARLRTRDVDTLRYGEWLEVSGRSGEPTYGQDPDIAGIVATQLLLSSLQALIAAGRPSPQLLLLGLPVRAGVVAVGVRQFASAPPPEGPIHGPQRMYGPFYRTAMDNEVALVQESGRLGGRAGRNFLPTLEPYVKAWSGPLPPGKQGYEFYTPIEPKPFGAPGTWVRWGADQVGVTAGTIRGEDAVFIPVIITNIRP